MLEEQSTIGAISRVLKGHSEGFVGTNEYYGSTREAVLVQRVLYEHWGGCAGTEEYYMSTLEAVLIQYDTVSTRRGGGGAVLVQQKQIGALGSLCWYSRVL